MSTQPRIIKYAQAIDEAHVQSLEKFPEAFVMGVGVADATGIFGTTKAVTQKFGNTNPPRVFDTPMSENTLTGMAVGAAITGMRPVLVHARNDFLLLTMDQIANHAAKWRYMSGGEFTTPFLIRAIVGRGWGQAAQHSQSLQSLFMHFPGLQVIMPVTAYDAKGLILAAMESDKTTICIEHRWLHEKAGPVPEEYYTIPLGKGRVVREGKDVTIVAISEMVLEAETAAGELEKEGISIEIIDPRTLRPLDTELILQSVKKTGRLVVCDTSWATAGASAEILAVVAEGAHGALKSAPKRITILDTPTPCSPALEAVFYPNPKMIVDAVRGMISGKDSREKHETDTSTKQFSGAF